MTMSAAEKGKILDTAAETTSVSQCEDLVRKCIIEIEQLQQANAVLLAACEEAEECGEVPPWIRNCLRTAISAAKGVES